MKYKSFLVFLFFSFLVCTESAAALTGEQIIQKVDANMTFGTARMESEMVIHIGNEVRTKKMISYAEGKEKSFAQFTYPARDKGVEYLKIGDNMWMYLPSVDKTIKIAGHMLRQSMMGSDFSYEDALESNKLLDKYVVKVLGEETVDQRTCFVLELNAKVKEVTYDQRKIWVDKELFIPLREELFAKSGKKLKVMTLGNVQKIDDRFYPLRITLQNLLRKDSLTEMITTRAQFNIAVPASVFTEANLGK